MAYALAGLHLTSEFELSGVTPSADAPTRSNTVNIRRARVPVSLNASVVAAFPGGEWDGERVLILIPGVARYLVSKDQIDVDALEGSRLGDVRAYLVGTVFGALCHLRGIFPLHASTIEFGHQSIAFTGDSGAGKSTMAAMLIAKGHRLISDDVTYIRAIGDGRLQIWPGTNRLRLWESAMEGLGYEKEGVEREFRGFDKFLMPARSPNASSPLRLDAIYQLEDVRPGASVEIEQLRGAAAVETLLQNTYRMHIAEGMGLKSRTFTICAEIARNVPVFRFRRPKDFGVLDTVLDVFQKHSAAIVAAS